MFVNTVEYLSMTNNDAFTATEKHSNLRLSFYKAYSQIYHCHNKQHTLTLYQRTRARVIGPISIFTIRPL